MPKLHLQRFPFNFQKYGLLLWLSSDGYVQVAGRCLQFVPTWEYFLHKSMKERLYPECNLP